MLLLSQASVSRFITPFSVRMQELGWTEIRDYDTVYKYSGGNVALMQSLASQLVELNPAVIFTSTALAARVSRQITSTVPIVCPSLVDPIESGLAESYARPGKNVTGIVYQVDDLQSKLFELAIEAVPNARKVGTFTTVASSQNTRYQRDNEANAAKLLNVTSLPIAIEGPANIEAAFDNLVRENVQVVIVYVDAVLFANRWRVAERTRRCWRAD